MTAPKQLINIIGKNIYFEFNHGWLNPVSRTVQDCLNAIKETSWGSSIKKIARGGGTDR